MAMMGNDMMNTEKPKIVCVVGPTASGKTAYAIKLAKERNGEIVSCDSMQIYKYMDIGTAKATAEERAVVPHHMIDFVDPNTDYSVADFVRDATCAADDILRRGKLPILCGGTGLYVDSVIGGIKFAEEKRDDEYRDTLWRLAEEKGALAVHDLLKAKDPAEAEKVHPNNVKRVIRALEICKTSGMTKTEADKLAKGEPRYNAEMIGLMPERELLYKRIDQRVELMMQNGLLQEVELLLEKNIRRNSTAMQAIGYKELLEYKDGKCTLDEAVEKIKQESRRYAKRQMTWFRRNPNIKWV